MSKPTDLDALARRYLDLWEDQLAGMAADRDVAEIMARSVELMSSGTAALAALARNGRPETGHEAGSGGGDPGHPDTPIDNRAAAGRGRRTAAAAAAHRPAGDGLADVARRLAALEQRVADLEAGNGGKRGDPKRRPPKRRS